MRTSLVTLLALTFMLNACANGKNNENNNNTVPVTETASADKVIPEDSGTKSSMDEILMHYMHIKDALVAGNGKEAAIAGKAMVESFNNFDKSALTESQKKVYAEVEDDAKEHAEHIGENASNIEHQREHFDILSNDMYDLIKEFGSSKVIYVDFCPMYNNKKGAKWLSESKPIKNPYYGQQMLTCGSVKEEIGK